jgi:hypothetical protein
MHNYIKFSIAFLLAISLFSFDGNEDSTTFKKDSTIVYSDTLTWTLLGKINFIKKPNKLYGEVMFPVINPKLKTLSTKTVVMSGFIIPIDNKNYALSKNVFAACFFCGKSGPETIVGLKFKGVLPKLKTDQYLTLKGTFRYNENDVEDWIYHIENAEIIVLK